MKFEYGLSSRVYRDSHDAANNRTKCVLLKRFIDWQTSHMYTLGYTCSSSFFVFESSYEVRATVRSVILQNLDNCSRLSYSLSVLRKGNRTGVLFRRTEKLVCSIPQHELPNFVRISAPWKAIDLLIVLNFAEQSYLLSASFIGFHIHNNSWAWSSYANKCSKWTIMPFLYMAITYKNFFRFLYRKKLTRRQQQ